MVPPRRINGRHVVIWETDDDARPLPAGVVEGPRCPKGCDVATAPEQTQGRTDRWVCVACGTEFTWKDGA